MSDPLAAIGGQWFKPDLSAFEPVNQALDNRPLQTGPAVRAAGGLQKSSARSVRAKMDEPSRRSIERKSEAIITGRKPVNVPIRPLLKRTEAPKKDARLVVTHEVRSARVVRPHQTCKERPPSNKPKGKGGSHRAFVPWCSRKR